jgi:hypothetical protein
VRVRGGKAETVKGGDGRFVDSEVSARAAGFKAMLTKFVKEVSCGFFLGTHLCLFSGGSVSLRPPPFLCLRLYDIHLSLPLSFSLPSLTTPTPQLPDMDFPINAKAEGRVVVPWEHKNYPNTTKDGACFRRAFRYLFLFLLLRVFFVRDVFLFFVFWTRRVLGARREFAFCAFGTGVSDGRWVFPRRRFLFGFGCDFDFVSFF